MEKQKVIISNQIERELAEAIGRCEHDRLFILVDETTHRLCLPLIAGYRCVSGAEVITIGATDQNKTLQSLAHVWEQLSRQGATRHSLMINLGGGMVTDLGGFAAATFKRGINYINIPTTLLSMVDASVGGKTGINFAGLKNEVGVFSNASTVILDTMFLHTLDLQNMLSGYAEMLKHGLINRQSDARQKGGSMLAELLSFDIGQPDLKELGRMVADSIQVKQRIVDEDPTEQSLRKALNLGHTVGHAFESLALATGRPILHGYAVAYGLICELYLSCTQCGFPTDRLRQVAAFVSEHYGQMTITCDDYPTLLELMSHDKKNTAGRVNFTLLADVGDLRLNQTATRQQIEAALDFYRDGIG